MSVVEQPRSAGLLARVQGMLMKPAAEWDVIDGELATVQGLFTGYACIVSAIVPIMAILVGLLAMSALSMVRLPFAPLAHLGAAAIIGGAVIRYVGTLLTLFAVGYIADALAPSFDGQKNLIQGMKLAVYAPTAAWVASVLTIIPVLGWLAVLAAFIYSIYAVWLGAPKLMKVPAEKAAGFNIVLIIAWIIVAVVIGLVLGAVETALFMGSLMGGLGA